jgi:hypothetical protein|tara:strand:- start:8 stop:235 length:228 start_codon:yes stop_codon:yes gene_type:complete
MINLLIRYGRIAFFAIPLTLLAYTPPPESVKDSNPPIKESPQRTINPDCLERIKEKQHKIKTELNKLKEMIRTKR